MNKQILISPTGERMVVVSEDDYNALVEAAEDAEDIAEALRFQEKLASGEEFLIPAPFVKRLIDGENPVRVWREFRGLSAKVLAGKAGIAQAYLSQIETGKREGPVSTLRRIAKALGVTIDDLVTPERDG